MPVAHIIGLGRSGIAAARLLKRDGWEVSVSDAGHSEDTLSTTAKSCSSLKGIPVLAGLALYAPGFSRRKSF